MKTLRAYLPSIVIFVSFATLSASAKTPALKSMSPSSKVAGSASFQLAVSGSNFTRKCVVTWNGARLPTTVVSSQQLQATVPSEDLASPGTNSVVVLQTSTGAKSNSLSFEVVPTTSTPVPSVTVTVSPATATLQADALLQFTATVTGTSNSSITWSASGGSIAASGLYTAPSTAGTYIVTATSVADTTKSASATVSVAASTASHSATLNWLASTSDVAAYNVYRGTQSGGPYSLLSTWLTALTYIDINVSSGATYYYVVTAVSGTGVESAYSQEAVAAIPAP